MPSAGPRTPHTPAPLTWLGVPGPGALRGRQPSTLGVHALSLPRPGENRTEHGFTFVVQPLPGLWEQSSGAGEGGGMQQCFHRHNEDRGKQRWY